MYEITLPNGNTEVHTTVEEFATLYKNNTAKEMSKIYGVPESTIVRRIQILGLRKRR